MSSSTHDEPGHPSNDSSEAGRPADAPAPHTGDRHDDDVYEEQQIVDLPDLDED